ncbi:hypothetical protein PHMEG_00013145 [Phytophthora megakarya]|uniref:Ubiquitin-like protease family profile domain-containing protein n=1 Tax=Phytophthora megakarya TaxID=4795 RepID=A0A225W8M7_9STRA|nr:hypothetical protein PHMEG_00013145 [Phytophthora megakarya]
MPVCVDVHWSFVVIQNPVLAIPGLKLYMLLIDSYSYHDESSGFCIQALEKYGKKTVSYLVKGFATKPLSTKH